MCGFPIANALKISLCFILSISTGLVRPQCSDISFDNHCSVILTPTSIFQDSDQYNIDNIFQVYY